MSKRSLFVIIAILLFLVLGLALNPSGDRHREAIRAAVAERSPIAGALGLGALKSLVVEYHSLGIASYTKTDDHVISFGAFGFVHVTQDPPPK
jgi:hypothetical protein